MHLACSMKILLLGIHTSCYMYCSMSIFCFGSHKWEPHSRRSTCIYVQEKLDAFILILDYKVPISVCRKRFSSDMSYHNMQLEYLIIGGCTIQVLCISLLFLIFQFHNLPCASFRWWSSIPLVVRYVFRVRRLLNIQIKLIMSQLKLIFFFRICHLSFFFFFKCFSSCLGLVK